MLLIDEVDKTDVEVEGLLLEMLSDFQVTIPELGTIAAVRRPFVVLTSNATRELSEALKRRCLYLHLDYPTPSASARSCWPRCPAIEAGLAEQLARTVATLRDLELKKAPSIAESVDWARTLLALGRTELDEAAIGADPRRRPQARLRPGARAVKELGLTAVMTLRRACSTGTSPSSRRCAEAGLPVSLAEGLDAAQRPAGRSTWATGSRCARRTPRRWSSGTRTGRPSTCSSTCASRLRPAA